MRIYVELSEWLCDNTNQEFLYRGDDAVDVFCKKINEIREEIKEKMKENKEILMTDEDRKDFETGLLTALYVVINLRTHVRMKKEQRNTKKLETTVILLVSTEVVLIAYVISTTVINSLRYQYFFIT